MIAKAPTTDRLALVTGGTRGIGEAISIGLQEQGYRVLASYQRNQAVADEFSARTGIPVFKFDASDFDATEQSIRTIEADMGPVEVLVNNAGITRDGVLHKMTPQNWQDVIETNLSSCFYTCHAVIAGMRERRFGRIVNISSINGLEGQFGQTNYAAAKAGMCGFTKSLAKESARYGITVNSVAPGYVDTDMVRAIAPEVLQKIIDKIPVGRLAKPEDVARCVNFLVADDADFITGTTLSVNGGQYMS
ncbi:acetoacetyl-CoA reductase [Simiduia agarivorans]|uniref:Acetoacetyl-coA reductase n=1 Tax=Simiduia agarivorans (strain DSM 21679 / JCM 13881 / BCRC 17597 / SA1) TaxID=1117647 RepID=K4KPM2_SIMAS|nr:acetoacetyl-CoA reductase [Simiduia agarivorans]AFV00161.1 acetoacetyl-coA reductase [Simiduia agarivorans SA1 = DSM 21679]